MGFSSFPDPAQYPSGNTPILLGYSEITADVLGLGDLATITGLQVTVNIMAGRRIRVTMHGQIRTSAAAGWIVTLRQDGLDIGRLWTGTTGAAEYQSADGSQILTPTAGVHTYNLYADLFSGTGTLDVNAGALMPAYLVVEDITGIAIPVPPVSVPIGVLAQAVSTTSGAAVTDADTDLSVNISVPAGRLIKLTMVEPNLTGTVASDGFDVKIQEGATVIQDLPWFVVTGNIEPRTAIVSTVISPSAGVHTYKGRITRFTGTGTLTNSRSAASNAYLIAEDITQLPALAATAPSSTLAYAEVLANQLTITTEVDLTGLSATVIVPVGRRLRITGHTKLESSVAGDQILMQIKEGSTALEVGQFTADTVNRGYTTVASVVVSPSAGTHTYKLTAQRSTGTGNVALTAAAGSPAWILVEDITGVSIATPALADLVTNPPRCKAYQTVGQSIASGVAFTSSLIALTGETYDTNGMHDNVTQNTRVTINTAGTYHIEMRITFPSAGTNSRAVSIRKNGVEYIADVRAANAGGGVATAMGLAIDTACAVGDYFEIAGFQDTGSSVTTTPGESWTYLSARWVAP